MSVVESLGAEVITLPTEKISVEDVLTALGERKITSLLVEDDSEIQASFIREKAFQKLIAYIAPKIIGGKNSFSFVGGEGSETIAEGTQLQFARVEKIGPDLKVVAYPI